MNADSARDDLAFMRALVQPDASWQRGFGQTYFAAGLCYGTQMILHGLQFLGVIPAAGLVGWAVGLGPTVVMLAILVWITARNPAGGGGVTARAIGAVFGAVGLTNLALVVIIGSVALRERSLTIWLMYACVVIVMQGMCWLVTFMLRRRAWFGVVAGGWFVVGIGMAFAIKSMAAFILIAGFGFLAFMLVPGLILMRQSREQA